MWNIDRERYHRRGVGALEEEGIGWGGEEEGRGGGDGRHGERSRRMVDPMEVRKTIFMLLVYRCLARLTTKIGSGRNVPLFTPFQLDAIVIDRLLFLSVGGVMGLERAGSAKGFCIFGRRLWSL